MDITIVLARICGFICLLIGVSVMNKKYMSAVISEVENSKALFWFGGFLAAIIGTVLLSLYNTWSYGWPVLITILGWLSLLKGLAILLMPSTSWHSFYRKFKTSGIIMASGTIAIIFGLVLLYQGFTA